MAKKILVKKDNERFPIKFGRLFKDHRGRYMRVSWRRYPNVYWCENLQARADKCRFYAYTYDAIMGFPECEIRIATNAPIER